ncbi:MAG: hypothetical protein AAGF83_12385, partial [Cyanobacteria bacterium P01_G01_bin.67]
MLGFSGFSSDSIQPFQSSLMTFILKYRVARGFLSNILPKVPAFIHQTFTLIGYFLNGGLIII